MLWHIGNTTVRTPYRLREALIALQGTFLNGNLYGRVSENAFAELLNESGVVDVQRLSPENTATLKAQSASLFTETATDSELLGKPDVSDLGRKWRSALSQLGFITHRVAMPLITEASAALPELSGRYFEITPNGYRLIASEQIAAQQECFLRSLLAYKIPSPIEPRYETASFSPLKYTIQIILGLTRLDAESYLAIEEFALYVQTSAPDQGIETTINDIIAFRKRKGQEKGHLRAFYREEYKAAILKMEPNVAEEKLKTKFQTLDDYADLSFRYLKATGLFKTRGRGITLNSLKEELTNLIFETPDETLDAPQYLVNLWRGAALPSDNVSSANKIIADLIAKIKSKNAVVPDFAEINDIALYRHILEQRLQQIEEEVYSRDQAGQTGEIIAWIDALTNGSAISPSGSRISIPRGEAPAYFEWVVWRAFLAINSLTNHPWDCRRFQIDQDFLPVSTAPGNGPDLIFEFADAILVVEVTFTASSRQEAAEGEPVRRHVAKFAEEQSENGKPVYGLFMAVNIDSNTAHTFRMGDWYKKDDTKINLQIVPLRLEDFKKLLVWGSDKLSKMPEVIQTLLLRCRAQANQEAPIWKKSISAIVDQIVRL
jgi:hypothetical protein